MQSTTSVCPTFYPAGLTEACEQWGCNCGPAALGAILRLDMPAVKKVLVGFDKRPWMNPTHMKLALDNLKMPYCLTPRATAPGREWPHKGLAFIQWGGPWEKNAFSAYQHTHWIAIEGEWFFDINNLDAPWYSRDRWNKETAKRILEHHKGNNGGGYCRTAYEVQR